MLTVKWLVRAIKSSLTMRRSKSLNLKKSSLLCHLEELPNAKSSLRARKRKRMTKSTRGRSTATSARTVEMSCAARLALRSLITSVLASNLLPRVSGIARIVLRSALSHSKENSRALHKPTVMVEALVLTQAEQLAVKWEVVEPDRRPCPRSYLNAQVDATLTSEMLLLREDKSSKLQNNLLLIERRKWKYCFKLVFIQHNLQ